MDTNHQPILSTEQKSVICSSVEGSVFLQGPFGTGKTTCAVERMSELIRQGVPAHSILILVPQRSLADPYRQTIDSPDFPASTLPTILTVGGLSQRLIDLFWPLIAASAGFDPQKGQPKFLTLETAQYAMAKIVDPMIEDFAFESIAIDPNRLYSQILDNLNKAAFVGFPHETIGERLGSAWMGDPGQAHIFTQVQAAANSFRRYCYEHNLLDFSLQIEIFLKHLWPSPLVRSYLKSNFRHLIFDNVEEDVPITHDLVREWLPDFDSALLIFNEEGGFRTFLGADPQSGLSLKDACKSTLQFSHFFHWDSKMESLDLLLTGIIRRQPPLPMDLQIRGSFEIENYHFITDMVDDTCEKIKELISAGSVSPGEIVVISPYMSDSLRFSLQRKLDTLDIPNHSSRPSRSLGGEPAVRSLLTFAKIAHPEWNLPCTLYDLRAAFLQTITAGDLNRADLLARVVIPSKKDRGNLGSFEKINPEMQSRITYQIGERYEILRRWLMQYPAKAEGDLDIFLSRLFGEILSQKGFGFHGDFESARVAAQLITSIQKFRWLAGDGNLLEGKLLGPEYIRMVESGILAAQYFSQGDEGPSNSLLLAPAYSFLMSNRSVAYQFWLDAGSQGWWERLYQPLTQPYVLSRNWPAGKKWTDSDDFDANQNAMARLVSGLIHRCQEKVYFCAIGLNESGLEERGLLLQSLQSLMKRLHAQEEPHV